MKRRWLSLSGLFLAVLMMGGCSTNTSDEPRSLEEESTYRRLHILSVAEESSGISELQLTVLRQDYISFADYAEAVGRTVDCIQDAGLMAAGPTRVRRNGIDMLTYSAGITEDADHDIMDACERRYSTYINWFWQTSTVGAVALDRQFESEMFDPLRECLLDQGVHVPEGLSLNELGMMSIHHLYHTLGDPPWSEEDLAAHDCGFIVGLDGWQP